MDVVKPVIHEGFTVTMPILIQWSVTMVIRKQKSYAQCRLNDTLIKLSKQCHCLCLVAQGLSVSYEMHVTVLL